MAEWYERTYFPLGQALLQSDAVLNHVWVPNHTINSTRFAMRGIPPYNRQVNGQSWLMNYEVTPDKGSDTYRIFYLGDSFIEGTCPEEDAVPSIVRKSLAVPGYSKVEVVNTGTASYAPTLSYLVLKTKALKFNPDLIVVNVDMTDVFDDSLYRATLQFDAEGEPVACPPGHPLMQTHRRTERGLERSSVLDDAISWLSERSRVVSFVVSLGGQIRRIRRADGGGVEQAFAWCGKERSQETQENVDWSLAMLTRLVKLAQSRGVKVVISASPHRQQLEGVWSLKPIEELADLCARLGVPFIDPIPHFRAKLGSTPPSEIYIQNDMHFNPKGYRMWGELHVEFLKNVISSTARAPEPQP